MRLPRVLTRTVGPTKVNTLPPVGPARSPVRRAAPVGALGGLTRWSERGWTRQQVNGRTVYRGPYMVKDPTTGKYLSFKGEVVEGEGRLAVTVSDLPPAVRKHPKGVCFSPLGNGVYIVGWMNPPKNVDEAIFYVEKVIAEALNRHRT